MSQSTKTSKTTKKTTTKTTKTSSKRKSAPKRTSKAKTTKAAPKKAKVLATATDLEDEYQKLSKLEHVLARPDTYIGEVKKRDVELWVYNEKEKCMEKKMMKVSLGALKVVDEILVNARDVAVKNPGKVSRIDIKVNTDTGFIEVADDGPGIPVEIHKEWDQYIMEGIFGDFMAGSNFGDQTKITGGKNGLGSKCISPDTIVPTWDGILKRAQDITVDDKLIGDDGTIRHIKNITYGNGKMYEVEQMHKGESYKVNADHILTLHMPDHKVIFWNSTYNCWTVLWWDRKTNSMKRKRERIGDIPKIRCPECKTDLSGNLKRHYSRKHKGIDVPTTERKSPTETPKTKKALDAYRKLEKFCNGISDDNTVDISVQDYLSLKPTIQKRLAGFRGECVKWPKKEVDLDPYLLGLWLGDGLSSGYGYTCDGDHDTQIIEYVNQWCEEHRGILKKVAHCNYRISSIDNISKGGGNVYPNPLAEKLRQYNLLDNKHIPQEYLVNDRETRLKVLAGIIDSDGSVNRKGKRVIISQGLMHKQLIDDIAFLSRSLGYYSPVKIRNTSWTHKGVKKYGKCYKIRITGDLFGIPTLLPRKFTNDGEKSAKTTGQVRIRPVGVGEYVGFSIDSNERFVINDFTVTHNCTNAYSTTFYAETRDPIRQKKHSQTWSNNMESSTKPKITSWKGKSGVTIKFLLDWKRFGMSSITDGDFIKMIEKRVFEDLL